MARKLFFLSPFLALPLLLAGLGDVSATAEDDDVADVQAASFFGATVTKEPVAPDGTPVQIHLPPELHMKNCGGSDGAGLCVFTSINHSGFWQNLEQLWQYQQWMKRHPGGGYPEKVNRTMDQMCRELNFPKPQYIQVESADIEILKAACRSGRMPGVTYGFSPSGRYGGSKISHMVSLVHADDKWFCCLDNNYPGTWEWMTPDEFRRVYTSGGRTGWSVIFLNPGPPPSPTN